MANTVLCVVLLYFPLVGANSTGKQEVKIVVYVADARVVDLRKISASKDSVVFKSWF